MLELDDPRWAALEHAHGSAEELPELLRRVATALAEEIPPDEDERDSALAGAWLDLLLVLGPGGEAHPASYAAVPHVVALAASQDAGVRAQLLLLVARVEAARLQPGAPPIPEDLEPAYRAALERVPHLVAAQDRDPWDEVTAQTMAGILLVARGHPQLGMALVDGEGSECPECGAVVPLPGWPAEEGG